MIIPNIDLILYSLHVLTEYKDINISVKKEDLSKTLSITEGSLNVYMSKLSKKGLIDRIKLHYEDNMLKTFIITDEGYNKIKHTEEVIKDFQFTPERHQIITNIRYNDLIMKLNNPMEKIFLLNLYTRQYSFDLNDYLCHIKSANNETNIIGYFKELEIKGGKSPIKPYNIDIFNMSLYGEKSGYDTFITDDLQEEDINSLLIAAETHRKQGRFDESKRAYDAILKSELNITQNQWFIANLGMAQTLRREGNIDKAIIYLESIKKNTKDKLHIAIANHTKATFLIVQNDFKNGIKLISSCIRSYHNFQMPLFISISYTIRGVGYYLQNKLPLAEKDWKNGKKYAKLSGSSYAESFVLVNLASIERTKGSFRIAENYLENAREIFTSKNDFEGLSLIEYNIALLCLQQNLIEEAREHMELSETIALPLPCPYEKNQRRTCFNNNAEELGLDIRMPFINGAK